MRRACGVRAIVIAITFDNIVFEIASVDFCLPWVTEMYLLPVFFFGGGNRLTNGRHWLSLFLFILTVIVVKEEEEEEEEVEEEDGACCYLAFPACAMKQKTNDSR